MFLKIAQLHFVKAGSLAWFSVKICVIFDVWFEKTESG